MWLKAVIVSVLGLVSGAVCVFHEDHDHASRFHDPSLVQDQEHIRQHMDTDEDLSKLSAEELEFRLFNLHDFDNNTQLDGLEIFSAIAHALPWTPEEEELKGKTQLEIEEQHTNYYADFVDEILKTDDYNRDGYLSYTEYTLARRREEAKMDAREIPEELKS
ncbi:Multiple coagulation factor deficiency protein 2-like [Holothuria leucospilota]|uniref:Multiple coagulation factor deficiency protein 2-like n=1 Tax=Holothuria leucospilota TaxID=206669 RepID=A0A9Q1CIT1_HOLLE|nr:Multiple coagulation factor deficiency protein 2-like [Holothuria leucospilota]